MMKSFLGHKAVYTVFVDLIAAYQPSFTLAPVPVTVSLL